MIRYIILEVIYDVYEENIIEMKAVIQRNSLFDIEHNFIKVWKCRRYNERMRKYFIEEKNSVLLKARLYYMILVIAK